jgi:hypothetical protein
MVVASKQQLNNLDVEQLNNACGRAVDHVRLMLKASLFFRERGQPIRCLFASVKTSCDGFHGASKRITRIAATKFIPSSLERRLHRLLNTLHSFLRSSSVVCPTTGAVIQP